MKNKTLTFEYTWCDYLTLCPHRENIEIGCFDCYDCKYYVSSSIDGTTNEDKTSVYKKYIKIMKGVVFCAHPNNFKNE